MKYEAAKKAFDGKIYQRIVFLHTRSTKFNGIVPNVLLICQRTSPTFFDKVNPNIYSFLDSVQETLKSGDFVRAERN